MSTEPDYDRLYETAESQAGYLSASQARDHDFPRERLSDFVIRGWFLRPFRGIYCHKKNFWRRQVPGWPSQKNYLRCTHQEYACMKYSRASALRRALEGRLLWPKLRPGVRLL